MERKDEEEEGKRRRSRGLLLCLCALVMFVFYTKVKAHTHTHTRINVVSPLLRSRQPRISLFIVCFHCTAIKGVTVSTQQTENTRTSRSCRQR